jgi:1-acyl-sn-glycerol-3-phosphate acyltransferase
MSVEVREETPGKAREEPVLVTKTWVYRVGSFAAWSYCKIWHRLRIEGLENIPMTGGAVMACNHQSFVDILIMGAVMPRHVAFVARDTLADTRWLGYVMRQCGVVLIKRSSSDRRALRAMAEHLELEDTLAIFPEGTRTRDGELGEFKGGALLSARLAKVPIVPVGIRGAHDAWPRGRVIPFPKKIAVRFGAPIDSSLPDAGERLVAAVQALIGDGSYDSVPPI